ncbi:MAG: nucleoside hydrolase [Spirochaetota bacterium]
MRHKVIMDVDPGIDDTLAILFARLAPQIELLGLTVVAGNVSLSKGCRNALYALHFAGDHSTPVFAGAAKPLRREHVAAEETHGSDGYGELHKIPAYQPLQQKLDGSPERAVHQQPDFMLRTLEQYPHEVSILALGPLTNLALAWREAPETLAKAKQIIVMGGSARHPGNCSPVAEYNFWVDPHAAHLLFTSELAEKITMLGLDVTHRIVFSPNLREVVRMLDTPLARFVYDLTRFYVDFHWAQEKTLGCVINDPLVPAFLLRPQSVRRKPAYVDICTEGPAMGQSVVDFAGLWHGGKSPVQVGVEVDVPQFFALFLETLFPEFSDDLEILLRQEFGKEFARSGQA